MYSKQELVPSKVKQETTTIISLERLRGEVW